MAFMPGIFGWRVMVESLDFKKSEICPNIKLIKQKNSIVPINFLRLTMKYFMS